MLAPIGTALLGPRTGPLIDWKVPRGRERLRIEEILYQPEAARKAALARGSGFLPPSRISRRWMERVGIGEEHMSSGKNILDATLAALLCGMRRLGLAFRRNCCQQGS